MGGMCSGRESLQCFMSNVHTTDEATGLSSRDADIITRSWKHLINQNEVKALSTELFKQLFETHPYMEKYFEPFNTKTDPREAAYRLGVHSLFFMRRMATYVEFIEDPTLLVSLLEKLARSHLKKGVTCLDIENLGGVFLNFLVDRLGREYMQKEVVDAWSKFFGTLLKVYKINEGEAGILWIF